MDVTFDISHADFQARKKRRIEHLSSTLAAASTLAPKAAPVSAPGVHEISTYLPGRLEFEHELENDAEEAVKDLEFGIVWDYGGADLPEDENDVDVKARKRWEGSRGTKRKRAASVTIVNGVNGHHHVPNGMVKLKEEPSDTGTSGTAPGAEGENAEDPDMPLLPNETPESIRFKLAMLDTYHQHVARRHEAKAFIFQRGLLEYKKVWPMPRLHHAMFIFFFSLPDDGC